MGDFYISYIKIFQSRILVNYISCAMLILEHLKAQSLNIIQLKTH